MAKSAKRKAHDLRKKPGHCYCGRPLSVNFPCCNGEICLLGILIHGGPDSE